MWTQQGGKLVGSGAAGPAYQGGSVAISGDGNTAIVGGSGDNPFGAVWVFTRSGTTWTQAGSKLVGSGGGSQGAAVALSDDGSTAISGGPSADSGVGAAWVFGMPIPIPLLGGRGLVALALLVLAAGVIVLARSLTAGRP
jgi:hypothetical protein